MAMNDLSIEQVSSILNAVYGQATGDVNLANVNTSDFTSVATVTLKTGYDTVSNSISQVLGRTIFSVRPYQAKFKGLEATSQRWGNHTRKLTVVDGHAENNPEYTLVDGTNYSPFVVNKPEILQTNFYGQTTFMRSVTIYDNQLDVAFQGPDQFASFITMVMTNMSDLLEQSREILARGALANFIAGKSAAANGVIHLVSEYNTVAGLTTPLTSQTVRQPDNFVPFMKWAYGRIKTLAQLMAERSHAYHINVSGKEVARHTPADRLKLYMLAGDMNDVEASVLSSVYNDEYLKLADHESVAYWQALNTPGSVIATPTYMDATGALVTPQSPVTVGNILGVMFDDEAIGVNFFDQTTTTDRNGRHRFTNWNFFENQRYWNDFTENGLILCLD